MGKHIVILGAGFGGLAAANELRTGLSSEHRITVVDRQRLFFMGLTKLWVLDGRRKVGDGAGNRTQLGKKGIDFVEGEVTSIDLAGKTVQTDKLKLGFDYMIVALGADYSTSAVPGFSKYAKNLYAESGCAEIRDELRSIRSGKITILVCGLPFKCPPAPYEAAFLVDSVLRSRSLRKNVSMQVVTPEPHPLPILGVEAGKVVTKLLAEREVEYHPTERVKEIRSNSVLTESGKEYSHTMVLAVPVHVVPSVVKKSGLVDQSGWIPVDPKTLATAHPGVYAVGDNAAAKNSKGQLIPRAGALAEEQGKVVAANLIAEITGTGARREFQGNGVCYMEVGGGKAAPLKANFYAEPAPTWAFTPPDENGFREKHQFLEERMKAWFN
jgi:sulfide:quinone oxidoreductase